MVNFRAVKMGNIAEGVLYRSEHPAYFGKENKAVVKLAKRAGIKCVLNLNDNSGSLRLAAEGSRWYEQLVKTGGVCALGMDFEFCAPEFRRLLREALLFMIEKEGPYLVHCYAGVDRTGIVCAILASFMGASLEEIAVDYSRSFYNGAESALYSGEAKAAGEQILLQLDAVFGVKTSETAGLSAITAQWLSEELDMSGEQLSALKAKLIAR